MHLLDRKLAELELPINLCSIQLQTALNFHINPGKTQISRQAGSDDGLENCSRDHNDRRRKAKATKAVSKSPSAQGGSLDGREGRLFPPLPQRNFCRLATVIA
ncbi:hypothetical protein XENORESO_019911 [Xenotaenia resolanae]|uniref:Uncharacterized protein n=1 Tax=Xenotaenia resolanae TaxID=208358 RepID=A0ABV0W5S1_9TELE